MKSIVYAAITATVAALATTAATADHRIHPAAQPITITVSCARYISKQVIWDRPMPIFLDGLITAGYTPERAESIGNRICRDEAFVGNMEGAGARMQQYLRDNPPARR
ncbi:hypothetical protein [Jannaschia pohangensis]|uniref:Uncharacterized protein n=1 Tax=Jannaschia pohangensis TaxID=390807 RepID=A0A1I3LRC2_9RHOB|nr:hypothetical protein [Jannaschia pohangensis]SFI87334.1 hypothetical protein SAMN04488095_1612 [Jannaschia pohangensis]